MSAKMSPILRQVEVRPPTCSDHPLDADAGRVDLLGELVDGLGGVLVGVRVDVGLYPGEGDWSGHRGESGYWI